MDIQQCLKDYFDAVKEGNFDRAMNLRLAANEWLSKGGYMPAIDRETLIVLLYSHFEHHLYLHRWKQ